MTLQTITVRLPESVYQQVKRRAQSMRRTLEDELVEVVTSALPAPDELPPDIADDLAQLRFLTDVELWQAANTSLSPKESDRMQRLLTKRQRDGLTAIEEREVERLSHRADRTLLIRAQSALLLKQRGHDISRLMPR